MNIILGFAAGALLYLGISHKEWSTVFLGVVCLGAAMFFCS